MNNKALGIPYQQVNFEFFWISGCHLKSLAHSKQTTFSVQNNNGVVIIQLLYSMFLIQQILFWVNSSWKCYCRPFYCPPFKFLCTLLKFETSYKSVNKSGKNMYRLCLFKVVAKFHPLLSRVISFLLRIFHKRREHYWKS